MGSRDPEKNISYPTTQTTTTTTSSSYRRWISWLVPTAQTTTTSSSDKRWISWLVPTAQTTISPFHDRRWISWLVPMFVIANVAAFIALMYINNCPSNNLPLDNCFPKFFGRLSFQPLRQNPFLGPSPYTLYKMGALEWHTVVYYHQSWRLITCIWLHGDIIMHLLLNMLSLLILGIPLERKIGFLRIGVLYLVSGVGGSLLSSHFLRKYEISVGSSGAVYGLLGAMLSELLTNWTIYNNKVATLLVLVLLSVTSLPLGIIIPHTDNFAHLGGFTTGFLLGFVLLRPHFGWLERHQLPQAQHLRVKTKFLPYQLVLFIIALALLIAGYTVGMIMLFKGKRGIDHCNWCRFLN